MITRELIQTAVTMRGGPAETGSIIWWRVQRSQANCIKFIGCGAGSTIVDEWSAIRKLGGSPR